MNNSFLLFVCFWTGKEKKEKRWYTQLKTVWPKTQGASVVSDQRRLGRFWICNISTYGGTLNYLYVVCVVEPKTNCGGT
jgi:hypothetical protein